MNIGMALGWDLAIARACYDLGLNFWAFIPDDNQTKYWSEGDKEEYATLIRDAKEIINVDEGKTLSVKDRYSLRNIRLVNCSHAIVALSSGEPSGTKNAVDYAKERKMKVVNMYKSWLKFCDNYNPNVHKEGKDIWKN
jgi:uncharacterized phage-like protein YoqJ